MSKSRSDGLSGQDKHLKVQLGVRESLLPQNPLVGFGIQLMNVCRGGQSSPPAKQEDRILEWKEVVVHSPDLDFWKVKLVLSS